MPTNPSESEIDGENPFEACPMAQAFEEIGSKWRLIILHKLVMDGEHRFNELQEGSPVDSSTLARVLKELEERDLVRRRLEDRPIATYYDLTAKGRSLAIMFDDLEDWAEEWTVAEQKSKP